MITFSTKEQLDQAYEVCKNWMGIRYFINKKGDPEIKLTGITFLVDVFRFVHNRFKHIPYGIGR